MLAHSNAPKGPDSISAIWFATGVKEVKKKLKLNYKNILF
jgi:hypothetical protein